MANPVLTPKRIEAAAAELEPGWAMAAGGGFGSPAGAVATQTDPAGTGPVRTRTMTPGGTFLKTFFLWAIVVAAGPNVRSMQRNDRVLFNPEDRYEVEVRGEDYIILRERDIHAVAAERLEESAPGLYL